MENVRYIPGDLVKINGVVNVIDGIYSKSFSKDRVIEANALEGADTARHRYDLDFGKVVTIEPIPLTPTILKTNGWKTQNGTAYFLDVKEGYIPYIDIDFKHKTNDNKLLVEVYNKAIVEIEYCHQLQHLLFGLGLPSELNV